MFIDNFEQTYHILVVEVLEDFYFGGEVLLEVQEGGGVDVGGVFYLFYCVGVVLVYFAVGTAGD